MNGVVLRDGRVHRVRAHDAPRDLPLRLVPMGGGDLGSVPELVWTQVSPSTEVADRQAGLVAAVGEGALGADGFVAVQSRAEPATVLWLACFDFSNPFESARFEAGVLKARNNLDEERHFDLAQPWRIVIHAAK